MKNIFAILLVTVTFSSSAQCSDISIDFTDSVSGGTVYFTDLSFASNGWVIDKRYWVYGDSTIDSVVLNPVHVYAQPGFYDVCLTIKGMLPGDSVTALFCTATICHQVRTLVSDIEEVNNSEWLIYPNPSPRYVRIKKGNGSVQSLSVYNMSGQLLMQTFEVNDFIELPDNTNCDSYFIKIETDTENIIRQIRTIR